MVSFVSDYITGAHPEVLKALVSTNSETLTGYGTDYYCARAKEKIKAACGIDSGDVCFAVGGTQTNQLVISTMLASYEGVISPSSGHINVHEAGAIEYTGRKVIELPGDKGKLKSDVLESYLSSFFSDDNREHMVRPGMVYISFPTEYGTLYTKNELESIYTLCKRYGLKLYIDGARLAYALASPACDISLKDLPVLCDVFYIGGTKAGALCGEAIVFTHGNTPPHFISQTKQHGALLAKGRVLGVQFDALFSDGLYFKIGEHAISMAEKLKKLFCEKGYDFYLDSPTNQQFIILENKKMKDLSKSCAFDFWKKYDDGHTVVRFATGWSTSDEDIEELRLCL